MSRSTSVQIIAGEVVDQILEMAPALQKNQTISLALIEVTNPEPTIVFSSPQIKGSLVLWRITTDSVTPRLTYNARVFVTTSNGEVIGHSLQYSVV